MKLNQKVYHFLKAGIIFLYYLYTQGFFFSQLVFFTWNDKYLGREIKDSKYRLDVVIQLQLFREQNNICISEFLLQHLLVFFVFKWKE